MEVRGHLPLAELERLEREERDARRARRLRIVILALKGYTAPAIAMSLGLSRRVCQAWVYRYNEQGLPGLKDQRGKPSQEPLTDEQQEQMQQRLEKGPRPEDGVCSLRGVDIQRILRRSSACCDPWRPSISCCIGWAIRTSDHGRVIASSMLRPRRSSKIDCPRSCDGSRRPIPGNGCWCSSRMNRDSGSKEQRPTFGRERVAP